MEGIVQHVMKQVSTFDCKNADDFLECFPSFASVCRSTVSCSSKSYKGRRGHQSWITIRRPLAKVAMMQIIICTTSSSLLHPAQLSRSYRGLQEKREKTEYGTDRAHEQLYAIGLTAARARPCKQHTEKCKR